MHKKMRGVSTFIAVLLLMALAVSAGLVIYAFTMGYLGGMGKGNDSGFKLLSLDSETCSTNELVAYVRNVGKGTILPDKAYVDSISVQGPGSLFEVNDPGTDDDIIPTGSVGKITIQIPSGFVAGKRYEVKIVSTSGATLSFTTKVRVVTQTTQLIFYEDYVDNDVSNVDFFNDLGSLLNFTNVQSSPDGSYGVFQEGLINSTAVDDYIDAQSSDVDNNASKGSHSNFNNMKSVDGMDTLTEEDTASGSGGEQEFMIYRGTFTTTALTYTITEGADYVLVNDNSSRAFIRITNSRATGCGEISGGGNQNHDTYTWRISNPSNIENSITFERDNRVGATVSVRVTWEIIEYIGDAGGENEIVVRQTELLSGLSSVQSLDGMIMPGSSFNKSKSVIFITSQASDEGGRNEAWSWLNTAEFVSSGSDWIPRTSIGKTTGGITRWVSYAVVEFSGTNWRVPQRIETTTESTTDWGVDPFSDAYTDVTIPSNMLNTSKAFLEVQYSTDNDNSGQDDAGDLISIVDGDLDSLRVRNRAQGGTRTKVAWLIESTSDTFEVEHLLEYQNNGGAEERIGYWTLSNTLRATNQTSVFGCVSSDGGWTAFPRGSVDFFVYSTTQIRHTTSDTGDEYLHSIDVVQWPLSEGGNSNYELDLEVQFTSVNTGYDVYELCVKTGTLEAEDLKLSIWNVTGSSWSQLASDLSENGWNNYTVTDHKSVNVTIQFKGGTELSDTIQDSWEIDAAFLHQYNQSYRLDQEMQWSQCNSTSDNAQLCIYAGPQATEDLIVSIWNKTSSSWSTVLSGLSSNAWNNMTIKSFLIDDGTVTIRFVDEVQSGDVAQELWNIDSVLIKTWDDI